METRCEVDDVSLAWCSLNVGKLGVIYWTPEVLVRCIKKQKNKDETSDGLNTMKYEQIDVRRN